MKKSCQDLGLYKMASVSKKKLQAKNKALAARIKEKVEGKMEMRRSLKDTKRNAAYWEERACKAEEELEGECDYVIMCMHT